MKRVFLAIAILFCCVYSYAQDTTNSEKKCEKHCKNHYKQSPHHFTMTIGYGFMLSDKHDTEVFTNFKRSDHARHMRHGINYELDYDYNFHNNFAFGLVFSMYNAFDSYYKDKTHEETFSDDRYMFYVGPSFLAHTNLIDQKWYLYARATFGFMNFRNAVRTLEGTASTSYTLNKSTFGYGLDLGAEYVINRYLSLDGQLHFMGGNVSKVSENDTKIELSDSENLSRLGIALGMKIKL